MVSKPPNWKPPFSASNERQRQEIFEWFNTKLQELDDIEVDERKKQDAQGIPLIPFPREHVVEKVRAWRQNDGIEIAAARAGHLGLLQKKYPHLKDFLTTPKLRPGQKFAATSARDAAVDAAVKDVGRIRLIRQEYYGKKNLRKGQGPSAAEISANRWSVTVDQINDRQKHPKKRQ
jgi:hypothetical protein